MTTSRVQRLAKRKLITPPPFVPGSVQYEVIMGSEAYGVSSGDSDRDVYGFCVPPKAVVFPHTAGEILDFGTQKKRFGQFEQHHVYDPDAMGGSGCEYDFSIYNIVKYFSLCMRNNPNMIDSMFVPQRCILYSTKIGDMVRDKRQMFLHKGAWHRFKGYAFSQVKKMKSKNPEPGSKRYEDIKKHGYDCYDDETTEFLTSRGWLSYDDIHDDDELATLNMATERVEFQPYSDRKAEWRNVSLVQLDAYNSRCIVTPGHRVLVSPARRNPATNYSYQYFPEKKDWQLVSFEELYSGKHSWYHIRKGAQPREDEHKVEDWYLQLSGLYLSDGLMAFKEGQVKCARLSQTNKGCREFFDLADELMSTVDMKKYEYEPETVWTVNRSTAKRMFRDYGHGAKEKALPAWSLHLSARQAILLWEAMVFGDGTEAPNGQVLYTSSEALASSIQATMVSAGFVCTMRGPFWTESDFGSCHMYQVYLPDEQTRVSAISIRRELDLAEETEDKKKGYNVKRHPKQNRRIVCFEVSNDTLVTRNHGRPAIQGNCKFAYHVVRLLNEVEEILLEHNLTLDRNREQLKSIRRGEWTLEQIEDYFAKKEGELETVYLNSTLQHKPDEEAIKRLLLQCLEEYYGSLEKCVEVPDVERVALREIDAALEKVRSRL